jgi:hypothetical protein
MCIQCVPRVDTASHSVPFGSLVRKHPHNKQDVKSSSSEDTTNSCCQQWWIGSGNPEHRHFQSAFRARPSPSKSIHPPQEQLTHTKKNETVRLNANKHSFSTNSAVFYITRTETYKTGLCSQFLVLMECKYRVRLLIIPAVRPFSHWGDATAIRSTKNHFTVAYWSNLQFVMALLPPARLRCDDDSPWIKCSRLFSWSNRSRVASVGERP